MKTILIGFVAAAAAAAIAATAAGPARAADECRGLQVCLPVAGPWVVVPPAGQLPVDYELRCPLPAYVVAGVDARLASVGIDVWFRGETGSPVGPGVTTGNALLFTAVSTGPGRGPTSFRPFIGCVPASGGGGRALTAFAAARPGGRRPARLVERTVVTRRVRAGETVMTVRCPRGLRLVGGAHAVAFRTAEPPPPRLLTAVRVVRSAVGTAIVARVNVAPGVLGGVRAEVQVQAQCRKAAS